MILALVLSLAQHASASPAARPSPARAAARPSRAVPAAPPALPRSAIPSVLAPASQAVPSRAGAEAPLIPRAVLFAESERASPLVSPDGTRIVYAAPVDGVMNLWVRTLGQADDRPVTRERKRGITVGFYMRTLFWAPDGKSLLYLQDGEGDEIWHLHQVDLETGVIRDLTPFRGVRTEVVAMSALRPDTALVTLNKRDKRAADVYRLDLRTGALTLDTVNPGSVSKWLADEKLNVKAGMFVTDDGGSELRVRRSSKGSWSTAASWTVDEAFSQAVALADGKIYAYDNRGHDRLAVVELSSKGRVRELARRTDAEPTTYLSPLRHPRTAAVQAVPFLKERIEWTVLDPSLRRDFEILSAAQPGQLQVLSRDVADRVWTVAYYRDDASTRFFTYDRVRGEVEHLFDERPSLSRFALAPMRPFSIKSRDGLDLHGYVTTPPGVEAKALPTVLLPHGGPWGRDMAFFDPAVQWLANRGYAVVQVDFRGSTGYGKAHLKAGNREWGGKMHDDLVDTVEWAVKSGLSDASRLGVFGGSYGGYAALASAAFTPDLFSAAVVKYGPSNLVTLSKAIPDWWVALRRQFAVRVGDVDKDPEFLRSRSPLFRADRIRIPMMIVQGKNDPRVLQAESEQIVEALKARGFPVDYLLFPDEGHGISQPENRMTFYERAEAFLAKHLGGRLEPARTQPKSR